MYWDILFYIIDHFGVALTIIGVILMCIFAVIENQFTGHWYGAKKSKYVDDDRPSKIVINFRYEKDDDDNDKE